VRAIKGKNGILSIIGRDEGRLFNKIDFDKFCDINSLCERDQYIAEELYKKNVIKKVRKENKVGYKIYPQKDII
jgi:hypothetical protein